MKLTLDIILIFLILGCTCTILAKTIDKMGESRILHKVFVYGTLKRGEPNHNWFSKNTEGYYKFLYDAKTKEKFPLIIATKYNIPFILYSPGML